MDSFFSMKPRPTRWGGFYPRYFCPIVFFPISNGQFLGVKMISFEGGGGGKYMEEIYCLFHFEPLQVSFCLCPTGLKIVVPCVDAVLGLGWVRYVLKKWFSF